MGINIHSIDCTNTDARILPCKVLDIKPNSQVPYQLYTTKGILQTRFSAEDMQDLGKVPFQALDATDPATLFSYLSTFIKTYFHTSMYHYFIEFIMNILNNKTL